MKKNTTSIPSYLPPDLPIFVPRKTSKSSINRDNEKIRKAIARLDLTETRLVRAQNAWQSARAALRALESRLDKKTLGGSYDVRDLAEPPLGSAVLDGSLSDVIRALKETE